MKKSVDGLDHFQLRVAVPVEVARRVEGERVLCSDLAAGSGPAVTDFELDRRAMPEERAD